MYYSVGIIDGDGNAAVIVDVIFLPRILHIFVKNHLLFNLTYARHIPTFYLT